MPPPYEEEHDSEVEVLIRLVNPKHVSTPDFPGVMVTTMLNGAVHDREIYNCFGEELVL
jgi:hypothetical protein